MKKVSKPFKKKDIINCDVVIIHLRPHPLKACPIVNFSTGPILRKGRRWCVSCKHFWYNRDGKFEFKWIKYRGLPLERADIYPSKQFNFIAHQYRTVREYIKVTCMPIERFQKQYFLDLLKN